MREVLSRQIRLISWPIEMWIALMPLTVHQWVYKWPQSSLFKRANNRNFHKWNYAQPNEIACWASISTNRYDEIKYCNKTTETKESNKKKNKPRQSPFSFLFRSCFARPNKTNSSLVGPVFSSLCGSVFLLLLLLLHRPESDVYATDTRYGFHSRPRLFRFSTKWYVERLVFPYPITILCNFYSSIVRVVRIYIIFCFHLRAMVFLDGAVFKDPTNGPIERDRHGDTSRRFLLLNIPLLWTLNHELRMNEC